MADPLAELLNTVLGQESESETKTSQNTANTSAQTGTSAQTTTGTQTNTGTQTSTGTSNTSGTIGNVSNSTNTINTTEQTTADLAALQEVYKRQAAGVTPEMLAAIFQEGSKVAPNLLLANSNALGARASGNTAVAQSLNALQTDLTNQAATLNTKMLADAGLTAQQIANLTRAVTQTGTNTTGTTGTQTQNLNTTTGNTQNTTGTQATTGTQNTTSAQTGTQMQASTGTENVDKSTTINTQVVKSLGSAIAAGVGINELFKLATDKGFVGNVTDFANWLKSMGGAPAGYFDTPEFLAAAGSNYSNEGGFAGFFDDPSDLDGWFSDPFGGFADGGLVGFADGGMPSLEYLDTPELFSKGEGDTSDDSALYSLLFGNNSGGGVEAVAQAATQSPLAAVAGGINQLSSAVNAGKNVYNAIGSLLPIANLGGLSAATTAAGLVAPGAAGAGALLAAPGAAGATAALPGFELTGLLGGSAAPSAGVYGGSTSLAGAGLSAAIPFAAAAGLGLFAHNYTAKRKEKRAREYEAANPGKTYAEYAQSQVPALQQVFGGEEPKLSYDPGYQSTSDGAADGGSVDDYIDPEKNDSSEYSEMLEALGMKPQAGGMFVDKRGLKIIHRVLNRNKEKPAGRANGGMIKGPGTGISDSIPAVTPEGQQLKVSNGEFIVPADVVEHYGAEAFQQLIDAVHVPANVQKMGG